MLLKHIVPWFKDYGLLDYFLAYLGEKERNKHIGSKKYRKFILNPDEEETWVCFLPWNVSFTLALKLNLIPKNKRVIVFEEPSGIVNPNPTLSKYLLFRIVDDLKKEISINKKINVLGLSVGTYEAFYVANHFNVGKLIAVVPGAHMGDSIYDGVATREVKARAIKNGYGSAKEYDEVLFGTNPTENLDNLPDKIELYIGGNDNFVKTRFGKRIVDDLIRKGKNPKVNYFKGKGHVLSLVQFGLENNY